VAVCWGDNNFGQAAVPASVGQVTQVSAGYDHSCATKIDGTVACWGYSNVGIPADLAGVTAVATGDFHSCAIKTNGAPVCWGQNNNGQVSVPAGIGTVAQISGGYRNTCAVKTNAMAACWGDNSAGQNMVPATVGTVKQISVGQSHACAVKTNGTAACWGDASYGQTSVPAGTLAATTVIPAGPRISGTLASGQTLRTSPGAWINSPSAYAYQWMSCDSAVANCKLIGTNQSVTLTTAERGRRIRATVIATNTFGAASRNSDPTAVIAQ
jgi:alpha-tubulin suppressor-like RCC1 family protein